MEIDENLIRRDLTSAQRAKADLQAKGGLTALWTVSLRTRRQNLASPSDRLSAT
jgi:hypothetical protein